MSRTPEQGHSMECLAAAMIAAIENYRDGLSDWQQRAATTDRDVTFTVQVDFQLWVQDGGPLHWAHDYLADGTMTCTCPDLDVTA